jgi:thiosulfate dehydrogenase (quinone) large subunit
VFGLLTRLGGLVGFMMAINLYLGLSVAPHEWHWSYGMLAVLQLVFIFTAAGRALGVDQFLAKSLKPQADAGNKLAQAFLWLT